MTEFLFGLAIVCALFLVVYAIFAKDDAITKFCTVFYGVIFSIYIGICGPALAFLETNFPKVTDDYSYIFMIIASAVAFISIIIIGISMFIKSASAKNIMFNSYFLANTAIMIALVVNCIWSNKEFVFLLAFIPLNWILPNVLLASSLLDIKVNSQKSKAYILFSVQALISIAGSVGLIISSVQSKVVNSSLFILIFVFIAIASVGLICAAVKSKRL